MGFFRNVKEMNCKLNRMDNKLNQMDDKLNRVIKRISVQCNSETDTFQNDKQGMNIQEALKLAIEIDGYVSGGTTDDKNVRFIKPAKDMQICLTYSQVGRAEAIWKPSAIDLIVDNWEVFTEREFSTLCKHRPGR